MNSYKSRSDETWFEKYEIAIKYRGYENSIEHEYPQSVIKNTSPSPTLRNIKYLQLSTFNNLS